MAQIPRYFYAFIIFLYLFHVATTNRFLYRIGCDTSNDCPSYMCPPPLSPRCTKFYCKCI
ncbi:putative Late nodulin [Medicago truncatula]|uniref:Nodule Cysteine-Rich (NCR) secreted peptide n=1 Tax=Medicago truncatula TaxID=3880 RepID=A0A072V827_MEDTR|nr:Nodule Cysteine-Rich (NCR) secreted peptide [Medicago truncatula]RHN74372.1 putative Late nodulin [Medicago truncatula]